MKKPGHDIPKYELTYEQEQASFVLQSMEAIDRESGGQADVPHRHDFYTVIWSHGATGAHYIDFERYEIEADTLFFVSPGQVHQVVTNPDPSGLVIMFTPEFLELNGIREDFISDLNLFRICGGMPPLKVSQEAKARLLPLENQMKDCFQSDSPYRYEALGAYLKLFLIACREYCTQEPEGKHEQFAKTHVIRTFKSLVEKHFAQWHKVAEYAEAMHITPNYLNEVIKSTIGNTAKEYIQSRQLLEAKRLVIFSDMTVKQIAFTLGFEDPSYFNKFFKRFTGQSLLEFKAAQVNRP